MRILKQQLMVHYYGIFYNTGQSCEARSRLYVHEDIYDEFVEKFVEKTKKLKLGNPFDKGTHMGAIIDQNQLERDRWLCSIRNRRRCRNFSRR